MTGGGLRGLGYDQSKSPGSCAFEPQMLNVSFKKGLKTSIRKQRLTVRNTQGLRKFVASAEEIETGEVYGLRVFSTWFILRVLALGRKIRNLLQGVVLLLIRLRVALDQSIESFENMMLYPNSDSSLFPKVAHRPLPSGDCFRASEFTGSMTQSDRYGWIIGCLEIIPYLRGDLRWKGSTTGRQVATLVERACLEPASQDASLAAVTAQVITGLMRQITPDEVKVMVGKLLDGLEVKDYWRPDEREVRESYFNYLINLNPPIDQLTPAFIESQFHTFVSLTSAEENKK